MNDRPYQPTTEEVVRRRFGTNHAKPCRSPDIVTCALWECQKADECRADDIRRPKTAPTPCDDAEVMRLWRECGLPEYFLGNGGTNHKLVEFARRLRAPIPTERVPFDFSERNVDAN